MNTLLNGIKVWVEGLLRDINKRIEKIDTVSTEMVTNVSDLSDSVSRLSASVSTKMDSQDPCGKGSFSLNRKANSGIGNYSFTSGNDCIASGNCSFAEGRLTESMGLYSHSEGYGTLSCAICSHAEGNGSSTYGENSHAEGLTSVAYRSTSHAEGNSTRAIGQGSHAQGLGTVADGECSNVFGRYNITDYTVVHSYLRNKSYYNVGDIMVVGNQLYRCISKVTSESDFSFDKFNLIEESNKYAHVVGNGTDYDKRSNAHTLDWDGNAWYAGDVYVGSDSGVDRDEGSKKLATEEYVDDSLKDALSQGTGGGIPTEIKQIWADSIRDDMAFVSDLHPVTDALLAWLESGDAPIEPPVDEPTEPTLTGITVTWSGDNADVGTNPRNLVTSVSANYSDGSSLEITSYDVSPAELVEGEQTVTVSYQGHISTKKITGNNTIQMYGGVPIAIVGKYYNNGNTLSDSEYYGVTPLIEIKSGATSLSILSKVFATNVSGVKAVAIFDSNKEYLSYYGLSPSTGTSVAKVVSADGMKYLSFVVELANAGKQYAYDKTTGEVFYAGNETPYYGKSNINE